MLELFNVLDEIDTNTTLCAGVAVPDTLFNMVSLIIKGIKIVVPILLIIWGMIDFAKSVIAKKEEDIKKYQKAFVSRLISAILVFLVIIIVQLVVNILASIEKESEPGGENAGDIWSCSKKFIEGVDNDTTVEEGNDTTAKEDNNSKEE